MVLPIASYVLTMSSDGRVASHGPVAEVLDNDKQLRDELEQSEVVNEKAEESVDSKPEADTKKVAGKLVAAEEIAMGRVGWSAGLLNVQLSYNMLIELTAHSEAVCLQPRRLHVLDRVLG